MLWPCNLFTLLVIFVAESGAAESFLEASRNQFFSKPTERSVSFTFLGTTSFLVEASDHQLIIDGFVSRPKHFLAGRIKPDGERIHKFLIEHNVCKSMTAKNRSNQSRECRRNPKKHLDLVVAMHGHYDHALDAPYIAGWAGARLLTYTSLKRLAFATQKLEEAQTNDFNWETVTYENIGRYLGPSPNLLSVGEMQIRLAITPHSENPISKRIRRQTPEGFKFRSTIWRMGLGESISMSITHQNKTALIVASAGEINDQLKSSGINNADVVFLGIGGLGHKSREYRREYWERTVTDTGAERVFLVHWDDHQKPLPENGHEFSVPFYERHNVTLDHFRELAKPNNVEVAFAPPLVEFDPFFGLTEPQ